MTRGRISCLAAIAFVVLFWTGLFALVVTR